MVQSNIVILSKPNISHLPKTSPVPIFSWHPDLVSLTQLHLSVTDRRSAIHGVEICTGGVVIKFRLTRLENYIFHIFRNKLAAQESKHVFFSQTSPENLPFVIRSVSPTSWQDSGPRALLRHLPLFNANAKVLHFFQLHSSASYPFIFIFRPHKTTIQTFSKNSKHPQLVEAG